MGNPRFGQALPCPDCLDPKATFDTFKAVKGAGKALKLTKDYAAGKLDTPWLLLVGTFGAGKTHLAQAVAHEHRQRLDMVLMAFVPSLMDQLRGSYSAGESSDHNEILARYQRDHLVILDDIGDSGNVTPWVREQILLILNNRYEGAKPTVMTTNNNMAQIADLFGGRIASRMWDTVNTSVGILDCADYRTGHSW
jgi:DNA replication protein DnaC